MRDKEFLRILNYFPLLFLVVSLISLLGCAKRPAEKEILMWLVGSEKQAQAITGLGREFYSQTGVKVRCEAIAWGEAHSKYLTSVVGEVTPDIGTMGLTWGTEFGTLGAMVNLKKAFPEEIEEIEADLFPGLLNSIIYKDAVYAIPFDMSEYIMYYRTDMIKEPPRTWKELTALLSELNRDERSMLIDWGSLSWVGYSPFLWQAGGDFYNEEKTAAALDSDEAKAALDYFTALYTKYKVPTEAKPLEHAFRSGDYPICISGNWKIMSLLDVAPEIKGKWAVAPLPAGPTGKRTAFIGGRVMGIFSQSKLKKESWEFMKYLSRPDIQVKLYEATTESHDTYLPPNIQTWEILPMDAAFRGPLKAQAMDAKGPPSVLGWDDSTRFIDTAIQLAVLRGKETRGVLEDANRELSRRIKK